MKLTLILISFIFNFGDMALAGTLTLETQRGRVFVPSLDGWELGKDMFGMPFIYFSPRKNGQRSNISFTATGVDVEIDLSRLGKDLNGYKKIKSEWATKVDANPEKYHAYKNWKNTQGHIVHQIGFDYSHNGKKYTEHSFYINCRNRLIYAKSLRLIENKDHNEDFIKLVNEMDCAL